MAFIVGWREGAALSLALALIGCGGGDEARAEGRTAPAASQSNSADERLDAAIRDLRLDPVTGPGFSALAIHFPDDFARLREQLRTSYRSDPSPAHANRLAQSIMREVAARETPNIVRASNDHLIAYLHALEAAYEAVERESPEVCAALGSEVVDRDRRVSQETLGRFSYAMEALIQAAVAGKARPTERNLGQPDDAEILLLAQSMIASGATEDDLALMDDPQLLAYAGPARGCRIRILTLKGMRSAPADTAARFTALMVLQSYGTRSY